MDIVDLDGNIVRAGHRIAYAVRDGDRAGMRLGTVTEILQPTATTWEPNYRAAQPAKLRVEVDTTTGYGKPSKPTLIEANNRKFVVIAK